MPGPAPKPTHLRQRRNRRPGAVTLALADGWSSSRGPSLPPLPTLEGREWHPLTLRSWEHAWASPMADHWLMTDQDALGRLAILWDEFYKAPDSKLLSEIRLQEARFGITPIDRSRLAWEVTRGDDAERKQQQRRRPASTDDEGAGTRGVNRCDPRRLLGMVSEPR